MGVGTPISFLPDYLANGIRVVIWLAICYLVVRMACRAAKYPHPPIEIPLARGALILLFASRAIVMAERWDQPLTWETTPATVAAIVLVWFAPRL